MTFRRLFAAAILPALLSGAPAAGGQNGDPQPAQDTPQTIRNLRTKLWDGEELVAEIFADSATLYNSDNDRELSQGELRGGRMIYYTQPRTFDEASQQVEIKFASGSIDGKKKIFSLHDGVTVDIKDRMHVETEELNVDYTTQTLSTRSPVTIIRDNASLTGIGLEADDMLRVISVLREGVLEMSGRPADLRSHGSPPSAPAQIRTILSCSGPLSVQDLPNDASGSRRFMMIAARDGVRLQRLERGRNLTATTDSAVLYLSRLKADGGEGGVEPLSATLRGSVRVEDAAGSQMTAATLDWDAQDDVARLTGAPFVELVQAKQRVHARTVHIDRVTGRSTFQGDVGGTFLPSGGGTLEFTAVELEILTEYLGGRPQPTEMRAVGGVHLSGEAGREAGPIDARGTTFWWNPIEDRGVLRGLPFARIDQGPNSIEAPEVVMEGGSMLVVKGPKRLRFTRTLKTGKKSEIAAAADGDIVYDRTAGVVTLRDGCEVRTEDFNLAANSLFLKLTRDGKEVERVTGFGRVRAERPGMNIQGDALEYNPVKSTVEISGEPYAVASFQGLETRNARIALNQETGRIELVGGRYGGQVGLPKQ